MNKNIVFLGLILFLSGFIIVLYLSSSGEDFYTIFRDDRSSAGAMLYQDNCASCHGSEGEGVAAYPALKDNKRSKQDIRQLIVNGSGEMPAFPDLTETDLDLVIDYMLEL
jgi:hypothetical protein